MCMRAHNVQIVQERAAPPAMRLPAPKSFAQALEVLPHELEIADAVCGLLLGHALDGIEGEEAHAHLAGQRLGEPRAHQGLEEDGGDLSLPRRADDGGEGGRARLRLGGEARYRDLREPKAARETTTSRRAQSRSPASNRASRAASFSP